MMNRRDLLRSSATLGFAAAIPFSTASPRPASAAATTPASAAATAPASAVAPATAIGRSPVPNALKPPAQGSIPVAFLISEGAVVIDFCGPWEVFETVSVRGKSDDAFRLYTVAETMQPVRASGGLKIVPDFTLATAPAPKIIVIPAQSEPTAAVLEWLRKASRTTDVTMSVCTGAFVLAKTGLLSGKAATTHHGAYAELAMAFPDIRVKRGARFVEEGNLASSGGLSSGIDLSLRVVERYFGREVAQKTAFWMEYQGEGWMNPDSNAVYAHVRSTDEHPLCPVCTMEVDPKTAPKSVFAGKTYYFCTQEHKKLFDTAPEKIAKGLASHERIENWVI
jgi:putative intracellular protease/amidase/YHS domain-containing protein